MIAGGYKPISSQRTQLIAWFCVLFLAGLALARVGWATNWHLVTATIISLVFLATKPQLRLLIVGLLAINLGLIRGQQVLNEYVALGQHYHQTVTLSGRVDDDPAPADRYQIEFHLENLHSLSEDRPQSIGGRIRVRGFIQTKLNRGDLVKIEGRLRPTLGNRQGQVSFAKIEVLATRSSPVEAARQKFFAGIHSVLPEPQGSLGLGFLVGTRNLLPTELTDLLAATGLTHIVAVSGYNLTILVRFMRRLLSKTSKYLALAGSLGLIGGFLAVTGISPSIFRASLVSGLALIAWYYGRPIKPMILILVPAAVTAAINPSYLWSDLGWYLSFLAFYGVLVVAPLIGRWRESATPLGGLARILVETLSAQLVTLPLILFTFAKISLVAPLANLLVLPLVPLAMLFTFVAGLSGMGLSQVGGWFSWPANYLLSLMVVIVQSLGQLPWAQQSLKLSSWGMLGIYGLIFITVWWFRRYHSREEASLV